MVTHKKIGSSSLNTTTANLREAQFDRALKVECKTKMDHKQRPLRAKFSFKLLVVNNMESVDFLN